jgi:hypothetical protein
MNTLAFCRRFYGRNEKQFIRLLKNLQRDLEPVGTLEEVLVEKIAQEYWRLGVAAWQEAEALSRERTLFRGRRFLQSCGIRRPSTVSSFKP